MWKEPPQILLVTGKVQKGLAEGRWFVFGWLGCLSCCRADLLRGCCLHRSGASRLPLSTETRSSWEAVQGLGTRLGLLRWAQSCALSSYRIAGLSSVRQLSIYNQTTPTAETPTSRTEAGFSASQVRDSCCCYFGTSWFKKFLKYVFVLLGLF